MVETACTLLSQILLKSRLSTALSPFRSLEHFTRNVLDHLLTVTVSSVQNILSSQCNGKALFTLDQWSYSFGASLRIHYREGWFILNAMAKLPKLETLHMDTRDVKKKGAPRGQGVVQDAVPLQCLKIIHKRFFKFI